MFSHCMTIGFTLELNPNRVEMVVLCPTAAERVHASCPCSATFTPTRKGDKKAVWEDTGKLMTKSCSTLTLGRWEDGRSSPCVSKSNDVTYAT